MTLWCLFFNYGIENYSWEDGYGDEPCDVTVGRNDNYSATDFFNKYLDTYDNLKCDDELVERVCDSDGEIRDNVFLDWGTHWRGYEGLWLCKGLGI